MDEQDSIKTSEGQISDKSQKNEIYDLRNTFQLVLVSVII